jgi:DNA polymerase-3 subunit gamma/tau
MDLFDLIMHGDAAGALSELGAQYADGADPMAVLRDLAELTHWVSVVKITPDAAEDPTVGPDERNRGQAMAAALPMPALTRMWQMLLKALEEVALAPNSMMAAEMAVIRLTHVADLPSPEALLRKLRDMPVPSATAAAPGGGGGQGGGNRPVSQAGASGVALARAVEPEQALARYATFAQVLDLIAANRDMELKIAVESGLRLARYSPGRIEFTPTDRAPRELAARLGQRLQAWTGVRWGVSVVPDCDAPTIAELRDAARLEDEADAMDNPLVQAVLAAFPGATVKVAPPAAEVAAEAALPVVEDEWDPFEED